MSDTSQGPGWWHASDGKWYPGPPPSDGPSAANEAGADTTAASSFPDGSPSAPPSPFGVGLTLQPPWPSASPDAATAPEKSRRAAAALVVGGVLIALLVIGGIIVTTRSDTDKKVSVASSSAGTSGADAGSSTKTSEQTPADLKTFHDTTNNYSIGTPPSWQQVSLSDPRAQASLDQLLAQNPQLARAFGDATTLASSGIKFLAVDPMGGSTVNVHVESAAGAPDDPSDSDLESVVPDLTQGLETTGATVTSHQIVTVNGRKAIQVLFDLPLTNGGTDLRLHGTAYILVTKDTLYIVTIVGKEDVVDQVISTFMVG